MADDTAKIDRFVNQLSAAERTSLLDQLAQQAMNKDVSPGLYNQTLVKLEQLGKSLEN